MALGVLVLQQMQDLTDEETAHRLILDLERFSRYAPMQTLLNDNNGFTKCIGLLKSLPLAGFTLVRDMGAHCRQQIFKIESFQA